MYSHSLSERHSKSPNVDDLFNCSSAIDSKRKRKKSLSLTDTTLQSTYQTIKCQEKELKTSSVSINVSHRCASSVVPQNSRPLTSKPKSISTTSASQRLTSNVSSLEAEQESNSTVLGNNSLNPRVEFVDRDVIQQPLKKRMKRELASSQLIISKDNQSNSISSSNQCSQEQNLAAAASRNSARAKENEFIELDIQQKLITGFDAGNRSYAAVDTPGTTDPDRQDAVSMVQNDSLTVSEIDVASNFCNVNCSEEPSPNKSPRSRPGFCASDSNDGTLVLNSGLEVQGVQLSPCTTSMVLTNINGMLLSLPAAPTIQVIVVNNYPTNDTASSRASRPDGSRLCAIAPAPPTMASTAGVSVEADQKGRLITSNRHRMYKCDHANCNKTYLKNSHLKVHQRIHTGKCISLNSSVLLLIFYIG